MLINKMLTQKMMPALSQNETILYQNDTFAKKRIRLRHTTGIHIMGASQMPSSNPHQRCLACSLREAGTPLASGTLPQDC